MKEIQARPRRTGRKAKGTHSIEELEQRIELYRAQLSEQDQKLHEVRHQLTTADARYSAMFDLFPIAFLSLNKNGCITELNQKAARTLRFGAGWLIGRPFVVFVAREDTDRFLDCLRQSVRGAEWQQVELDLKIDGHIVPVQISMQGLLEKTTVVRVIVVDLTDVKKVETQLHEALARWSSLVQTVPDLILTLDHQGHIQFVNRALGGVPLDTILGLPLPTTFRRRKKAKFERV